MNRTRFLTSLLVPALVVSSLGGCSVLFGDDDFAPPAPVRRSNELRMTATGVPGLTASTRFAKATIEAAVPGYQASPITMATESSESVSALALFKDGLQVLQVVPNGRGGIGAVHGVSERLVGPAGERIGMSFREVHMARSRCREGSGNWFAMPICTAAGAPNVTLVFSIPGYISTGGLPDDALLGTATLQRMIWSPTAGAS